jgi:hypothetical protein
VSSWYQKAAGRQGPAVGILVAPTRGRRRFFERVEVLAQARLMP